jgi:hypothetical protein
MALEMRHSFVATADAQRLVAHYESSAADWADSIAKKPHDRPQMRHHSVAMDLMGLALYRYVSGYNVSDVRQPLVRALPHWLCVFDLYGTYQCEFPAIDLTKTDINTIDENYVLRVAAGEIDTGIDNSLTGSSPSRRALHLAIIIGTNDDVAQMADRVSRVMDMEIKARSESWSNVIERRIVECLLAHVGGTQSRIRIFGDEVLGGNAKELWFETQALHEIKRGNGGGFLSELDDWLLWNEKRATDKRNLDRSHFYYSLPALACCKVALDAGVVKRSDLPGDNVYLPLALLEGCGDNRETFEIPHSGNGNASN